MTEFTRSDYSGMIEMWGICTLCERSVHDNSDTLRKYIVHRSCGCLVHADEKCPFPKVRESHEETSHGYERWGGNSEILEYCIVSGFVEKTFPFETVESAFKKCILKRFPFINCVLKVRADSKSKVVLAEQKAEEATNKLEVIQ